MRAPRSSREENTIARAVFSNSAGAPPERLRMAPVRRQRAEQRDQPALRLQRSHAVLMTRRST
jgi:hypothetical protein